jgi:plastocyanin
MGFVKTPEEIAAVHRVDRPALKQAFALLLAAAFVLGACGGDDDDSTSGTTAAAGDEIVVKTSEFAFDPADVTMSAGKDYTVVVDNSDGKVEHDWVVEGTDITILAPPRGTADGAVKVDEAGTYTVYCSIAGHREAGMEGTLVVE